MKFTDYKFKFSNFFRLNFWLFCVLLLFLITRLYQIDKIPASLYWDEASIAYNAYSIASTGKDEWGDFLPLHFRAFGEFKLPVYIYSVAVFEKLTGLSEMAVRLPAVLFSLGVIFLTYLLTLKIFNHKTTAVFSALILAILPWFFIFSRTGYEATAGLMFYLSGIYLFLLSKERPWLLILAAFSFILSIYSYNSFRITVPLTVIFLILNKGFLVRHLKNSWSFRLSLASFIILLVLGAIPIFRLMGDNAGMARFQTIGISTENKSELPLLFARNYFSHLGFEFLFGGDKNMRSQQPGFGQLYLLNFPFLVAGLVFIFKKRSREMFIPIILLLFSFIPAALTRESPHALRAISAAPFIAIISAMGAGFIINKFKFKKLLFIALIVGCLTMFSVYFKSFVSVYPTVSSPDWQYGYKKLFIEYKDEFEKYDKVVVSDYMAQPYIFALFYLKIDPVRFLSEVEYNSVDRWGFSTVSSFNNFQFRKIDPDSMPEGSSLIFASPLEKLEIPEKSVVKNLDGSVAFYVYNVKQ